MSKEQWTIYLYDVWPDERAKIMLLALFVSSVMAVIVMYARYSDDKEYNNRRLIHDNEHKIDLSNTLWIGSGRIKYVVPTVLLILMLILSFLPSKNAFVAMVATPALLESLESGRLSKVNKLIDLGLNGAMEELKDNK